MPKKLMLKGRHIKVSQGPEPDEIMWENLEVPDLLAVCVSQFVINDM
jgi:hypothetical protein